MTNTIQIASTTASVAINLACGVYSVWRSRVFEKKWIRRYQREGEAMRAAMEELAPCVAMVAWLSRPESGAPEGLREECAKLLPKGIIIDIESTGRTVH